MNESQPEPVNDPLPDNNENPQESKEKNIKTIEIEFGGQIYSLEAESYDFEYPKTIQQETGIVGYSRTKIPKENLESLKEKIEAIYDVKEKSFGVTKALYALLDSLSDNEYPSYCHTHKYGYWAPDAETGERYKEYFKQNFFTNKIYDLSLLEKEAEKKIYPFSNANTLSGDNSQKHSNITIYDTQSHQRVSAEQIPLGDVLQYKTDIENGDKYAVTTFGGLNFSPSDFYQYLDEKEICFGYSYKLDEFMREYYEKSLCELARSHDYEFNDESALLEVGAALMLDTILKGQGSVSFTSEDIKLHLDSILRQGGISTTFSKRELEEINSRVNRYIKFSDVKNREYGNMVAESRLPIFIGDKEIPQLSWGHAKYAHYMNEKGLNFFKFKHADHLPIKSE